jgi:hypothetical protein
MAVAIGPISARRLPGRCPRLLDPLVHLLARAWMSTSSRNTSVITAMPCLVTERMSKARQAHIAISRGV